MSELQKAKAEEIRLNMHLKRWGTYQRWLIIWLFVGGIIKVDVIQEVMKWING